MECIQNRGTIGIEVECKECRHINQPHNNDRDLWNIVNVRYCDGCGSKNVDIELKTHGIFRMWEEGGKDASSYFYPR